MLFLVLSLLRTVPPHSEMAFTKQLLHLPGFPCMSALSFWSGFGMACFDTVPFKGQETEGRCTARSFVRPDPFIT